MNGTGVTFTAGVVGHGVKSPDTYRKRPDLCAEYGHPGVTYNPAMDKTWCLCGEVIREGNHFTHAACCGGPLTEDLRTLTETSLIVQDPPPAGWRPRDEDLA